MCGAKIMEHELHDQFEQAFKTLLQVKKALKKKPKVEKAKVEKVISPKVVKEKKVTKKKKADVKFVK